MPPHSIHGRYRFPFNGPLCLLFVALLTYILANTGPLQGAAFDSADQPTAASPLKLLRITPSGDDVPPGQEIVFQFDRPVVPLGRMERKGSEIPIAISPALNCQ